MHISIPTVLSSLLLLLAPLSAASSILTISIPPSAHLQNPNSLPASTHATLTSISLPNGPLKAPLTRSSTLVFNDLPPSSPGQDAPATRSYLLDIHSREYVFVPYRVDVDAQGNVVGVWETYRGHPWDNKGVEKMTVTEELDGSKAGVQNVVVEARVVGKRTFYEERQKCELPSCGIFFFLFFLSLFYKRKRRKKKESLWTEVRWLTMLVGFY